jgi:hypothetical protein
MKMPLEAVAVSGYHLGTKDCKSFEFKFELLAVIYSL